VIEGNYALPDKTKVEPQTNTDEKEEDKPDQKEP
jgi:hypothetical protein